MAIDLETLRATVLAEVPWHPARTVAGTLRFQGDNLVVEPRSADDQWVELPVTTISRAAMESTLGMLPVLRVWHTAHGGEQESRFAFSAAGDHDDRSQDNGGPGLSDRIGPGVARDAAQAIESGFRVLTSGLSLGKRTARQAVEGLARHEEYQQWPAAIAQAQEQAKKRPHGQGSPQAPAAVQEPIVPPNVQPPTGNAIEQFAWFRERVPGWLAVCSRRARELGVHGVPVIQPMYPLDSDTCRIVVIGEFSRGKSTLINALFGIHGEIALPTGMTPTTPIAFALRVPRVGEVDGATITYRTRRQPLELTLDEFRQAARLVDDDRLAGHESAPDPNLQEARRVEVRITGAYLPSGVEIEDTPGLNEQSGRSAGALSALGRADLILFVLAADQLLGDLERDVITNTLIKEHHRNVLFLVNFWDNVLDEHERENLRTRARAILADFPSPFRRTTGAAESGEQLGDVFYVSALQAARAQRQRKSAPDESGIPLLRARLRELVGPESHAMLLRARAGRARRFVRILRNVVSRSTAERSARAHGAARPATTGEQAGVAAVAAKRVAAGLPDAMLGATARLQAGLEQGTVGSLDRLTERLAMARATEHAIRIDDELRRALLAEFRTVAADYARAAQAALDLVVARARAAFLQHGLTPPAFDVHLAPMSLSLPPDAEPDLLLATARGASRLLREDLERQSASLTADLLRMCDEHPRTAQASAGNLDTEQPSRSGADALAHTAGLRLLEEDLLRLDDLLARMT